MKRILFFCLLNAVFFFSHAQAIPLEWPESGGCPEELTPQQRAFFAQLPQGQVTETEFVVPGTNQKLLIQNGGEDKVEGVPGWARRVTFASRIQPDCATQVHFLTDRNVREDFVRCRYRYVSPSNPESVSFFILWASLTPQSTAVFENLLNQPAVRDRAEKQAKLLDSEFAAEYQMALKKTREQSISAVTNGEEALTLANNATNRLVAEVIHGEKNISVLFDLKGEDLRRVMAHPLFIQWAGIIQKQAQKSPQDIQATNQWTQVSRAIATGRAPITILGDRDNPAHLKDIMKNIEFFTWMNRMSQYSRTLLFIAKS